VRLSTVAFDLLWERLDLGAYPLVFPLLSHGATATERVRLLDGARRELLADGVLVGPDVAPHVETWLRTLAAPAEEVHVRRVATTGVLRGTVVRGVADGDPDPCVRAVLVDGAVHLEPAHPGGVVAAAVELLPASGPGPGGQLSAPTDGLVAAFTAGAAGPEAFAAAAHGLGAGREDALALGRALATTHATAQLGVATTRGGTRTPHPRVVVVHDTAQGRYVVTERPAPDGTAWSTLRPATSAQVARAVAELLAESRA
jgi:hypothetical protein